MTSYYAWDLSDGDTLGLVASDQPPSLKGSLVYVITADTYEEAMAIHHLRQGLEPYVPCGKPAICFCGAVYYPSGSGQCWQCRKTFGK